MSQMIIEAPPRRGLLAHLRGGRPAERWTWRRALALLVMMAVAVVGLGAFSASAAHANEEDIMKYSFYRMASNTTALFSTVQEPGSGETFNSEWTTVVGNAGSAGSLLGYADPNFSDVGGWLMSKLSGSSDAIGYDTLLVKDDEGNTVSSAQQGMVQYAFFGATLKGMGLDGTSTGLSLGFMNWISGGIVMLLYLMSAAVDFLFFAILSLISLLNPFKLLFQGVNAATGGALAEGMVGGDSGWTFSVGAFNGDLGPIFSGLSSWISGWYQALVSLSWTVMVPLFIAILLVGMLLFKKMNRGGAVKKILIRIGFLGLGLPLMGMMYTGMVDSMAASAQSGNAGATRVVMSTYVDFENWAMKSRLAVPSDAVIAWDTNTSSPTGEAQREVRNTALAINNQTLSLGLDPIVTGGNYDASWANQAIEGGEDEKNTTQNTYLKVVNVLVRYMANAQVSAASFETQAKGQLTKSSYYEAEGENVKHWFESIVKKDAKALNSELTATSGDKISPVHNPVISVNGGLQASGITGSVVFSSDTSGCSITGRSIIPTYGSDPSPRSCNLSPLAMYNYLNTDFGSTSMTMYSSSNVMSEATRSIHNSVNQVGTGTMSALYWFNTVVLLGAFVLIGFGYAFAILFANIRRSFQILTSIPFATLGAIAAIAKVIVYTVALVLEVIITIFLYKIIQEFLISIPQIIEMPFALALNNGAAGDFAGFVTFLTSGWAFGLIVTLLSIIGIIAFTVMAMRSRKAIVKAMEEAVTKIVEKFTETSIGSPGGGGKMAPALAGGLAAGAGAAAANRMMGGSMTKDAKGADGAGVGGPEGVSTEAGGAGGAASGADGNVSGEIETGDGTLGIEGGVDGPADGNGDPGNPLALTAGPGGESGAAETAEGKRVEAEGLSQDGGAGEAGGTDGRTFEADSEGQVREAQAQPDAGDAAAASLEESAEGYKEADKKKLAVGKEGAEATGHAALAVGKAYAGDAAGAAESGGRAVEHAGKAVAANEQAQHAEKEAGRSSLDKPDQKHAARAAKAEQVSQAGGMVANAAGTASATSGGGAAKGAQGASKQAGQQAAKQPRPAQAQAPRPQQGQQPRAARPQQAAPQTVVNKSSSVTNSTDRRSKTVNKPRKPKPIRPSGTGKRSGGKGKGSGK